MASEDDVGHQELVETTKSLKEAKELAQNTLELEGIEAVIIFQELNNGDTVEIERLTLY